jgi:hypothetical protein
MRKLIFVILLSSVAYATPPSTQDPALVKATPTTAIAAPAAIAGAPAQLPEPVVEALKKWNPKFAPFSNSDFSPSILKNHSKPSPAIASADFNGDSIADYAVIGSKSEKEQAVVAVVSDKKDPKKWTTIVVDEYDMENVKQASVPGDTKMEKGVPLYVVVGLGEAAERYKRVHKRDIIQIEAYMGSIQQFAIEGSKAMSVQGK